MRFISERRFARIAAWACVLCLVGANAFATDYVITDRQIMTDFLPGTFAVLANPATGTNYYGTATDPVFGTTQGYAYAAVLDTGASGNVLSAYEAEARNLPVIPGATYEDVGIGGMETFNISQSTTLKLKAITGSSDTSETVTVGYSSFGNYNFQIRQEDPAIEGYDPVYINIVGTPVINQHVMHCMPNATAFTYHFDLYGMTPAELVQTELLEAAPSELNASSSELVLVKTNGDAIHVGLNYKNFVTTSTSASTSTNPMISDVEVVKDGQAYAAGEWLFDSGASVTMVGTNLADAIGIDVTDAGSRIASTSVMGVGGEMKTIYGYGVDSLLIPTTDGTLAFEDIVVFVLDTPELADLPGIFGMNLINQSFSAASGDLLGNVTYDDLTASAFSDWYVIPAAVPEPGAFVLCMIAAASLLLRRLVRRRR